MKKNENSSVNHCLYCSVLLQLYWELKLDLVRAIKRWWPSVCYVS